MNGSLVLILVLEVYAVDRVYLSSFKMLTILGGLTGALPVLWIVIDIVMSLFRGERDALIRRLSQSRSFTRALGISVALASLPAAFAFPELARPRAGLLIVPGNGLFSRVADADTNNGAGYKLSVRDAKGKVLVDADMTGHGALLLARDPGAWLEGGQELLKRVKAEKLAAYPGLETDKWAAPVKAELPRRGKIEYELFAELDGKRKSIAVGQEVICPGGTKLQVIFLEESGTHEPQTCVN